MTTRAVLFDVGGPIDTEMIRERAIDARLRAAVEQTGIPLTDEEYAAANDWAVATFAPDTYAAIIWRLTGHNPDLARTVYLAFRERASEFQAIELRPGIVELLAELHQHGLVLGLVANQPQTTLAKLDDLGIGPYFHHRIVSGVHGLRKPD